MEGNKYFIEFNNNPSMIIFDGILKISKEGFWIRGIKVEQNENEAELVYNEFLQYLQLGKKNV